LYSLLAQGVAILTSTSYLDEAERCHRVGLLYQGRMLFCDLPDALKKRFPGGVVVVHSADAEGVRAELSGADGVRDILLVGDHVHVFVDDATKRLPELRRRLDANKVAYGSIEQVAASIEDLFVSAVEREAARQSLAKPS